jgi:RNA ligase (TIGR02306 family)
MEKTSTHKCEIIPVSLEPCPGSDFLSVVRPFGGYTVLVRTEDWKDKKLGAYVVPDSLVNTCRDEFAFLKTDAKYNEDSLTPGNFARIRAKKMRGVVSYGLLVPAPEGRAEGDDVSDFLGIRRYEPGIQQAAGSRRMGFLTGGEFAKGPNLFSPKYDVDSFQRWARQVFTEGEHVWIAEKLHGQNSRYVFHDGQLYCGSRTEWKKEYAHIPVPNRDELAARLKERKLDAGMYKGNEFEEDADKIIAEIRRKNENPLQNIWWKALKQYDDVMDWLQRYPDNILYGELYGAVQNLHYGVPPGEVRLAFFDILKPNGKWASLNEIEEVKSYIPWVPHIATIPYNFEECLKLAEGPSLIPGAKNIREGVVIQSLTEREHPKLGRVKLKIVSAKFLEKDY